MNFRDIPLLIASTLVLAMVAYVVPVRAAEPPGEGVTRTHEDRVFGDVTIRFYRDTIPYDGRPLLMGTPVDFLRDGGGHGAGKSALG